MIRIPFILIAVLLVTTTYTTPGLEDDLVFYFTFDNVKNKRVLEASGNNLDLCIGCAAGNPQYTFKNGSIDEVGLWRRALSQAEIKEAMKGFLAISPRDFTSPKSFQVSIKVQVLKERDIKLADDFQSKFPMKV